MKCKIKNCIISGVASVVPSGIRTIEDDAHLFNNDAARIKRLRRDIGINKRHIILKDECTSDLCEQAAKILLGKIGYDPQTIDGLIMVTQTPDYFQPATSYVLHGRLGLSKSCATFDVNLGCSGYIYGLWLASLMISAGNCKRILVLAGDTMSRCVSPYDSAIAPLFGDAGSATLMEYSLDDKEITFVFYSDGVGYKNLIIPAGAFRKRPSAETARIKESEDGNLRSEEHLYMNGAEIFNFTIREIPSLVEEVLLESGWQKEEVDYYIFHQANKFIIQNIARRLKIPIEKSPYDVFEKYGNQSSASIPVTICENLCNNLSNGSIKALLVGFGTGLSWGGCALKLGNMACFPVVFYEGN